MKKKTTLALVMVLMLASVMMLSACVKPSVVTTTEGLAEYFEKINNGNNFTGKATLSQVYDGESAKITIELKRDGNKIRLEINQQENLEIIMENLVYMEIDQKNGILNGYSTDYGNGSWTKREIPLDEINEDIAMILNLALLQKELLDIPDNALFNAERYTFSEAENCFIFNEDGLNEEIFGVIKITVTVVDGKMTFNIVPETDNEYAIATKIKVEFNKFGKTSVTLPDVTPNNPPVNTTTLEQAFEKLEETNLRIAYTMEMKGISMTIEAGFDFNLAYIDLLGTIFYMEIDLSTGISYIYIPDDYGRYTKAKGSIDDILGTGDSSDDGSMDFIYDASSYEYSSYEERYVLKQSAIDSRSGITGGYLVFDNDSITITMTQLSDDGTEMTLTMRFYDFGKVTVELPSTNN